MACRIIGRVNVSPMTPRPWSDTPWVADSGGLAEIVGVSKLPVWNAHCNLTFRQLTARTALIDCQRVQGGML